MHGSFDASSITASRFALYREARLQLRRRRTGWRHSAKPTVQGPREVHSHVRKTLSTKQLTGVSHVRGAGGDDDAQVELPWDVSERRRSHGVRDRVGCDERKNHDALKAIGPCLGDGLVEERPRREDKSKLLVNQTALGAQRTSQSSCASAS